MSNWELCPKCKGSKKVQQYGVELPCDICDGKGIISSLTGLPSYYVKTNNGIVTQDDVDGFNNVPKGGNPTNLKGYGPDANIRYVLGFTNIVEKYMKSMTDNGFVKTKSNI